MELRPNDSVLVITSAGCNALDYALAGARHVVAVDINPRQNALLELKLAGIRGLRFEDFFAMFGLGRLDRVGKVYAEKLRPLLSPWSQFFWDQQDRILLPGQPAIVLLPRHLGRLRHADPLLHRPRGRLAAVGRLAAGRHQRGPTAARSTTTTCTTVFGRDPCGFS